MILFKKNINNQYVLSIDEQCYENFSFKLASPINEGFDKKIAILDEQGQQIGWIDDLLGLEESLQQFVRSEILQNSSFLEISSIDKISSNFYPSVWTVHTNVGPRTLCIENEDGFVQFDDHIVIGAKDKKIFIIRHFLKMKGVSQRLIQPFLL